MLLSTCRGGSRGRRPGSQGGGQSDKLGDQGAGVPGGRSARGQGVKQEQRQECQGAGDEIGAEAGEDGGAGGEAGAKKEAGSGAGRKIMKCCTISDQDPNKVAYSPFYANWFSKFLMHNLKHFQVNLRHILVSVHELPLICYFVSTYFLIQPLSVYYTSPSYANS